MSGRPLFERLSEDPRVLEAAWREVNRNARSLSHGVDNVRLDQFSAHAQRNLADLRLRLKNQTYKFSSLRAAALPKPDGTYRPIQVATINDRIVLKAIEQLIRKPLNNKYNLFNNPVSYAYISTEDILDFDPENPQTFKGVRGALEKLKTYSELGFTWALKADIIDFFPSVNINRLLDEYIYPVLPDSSINVLIKQAFDQEVQLLMQTRKLLSEQDLEKFLAHNGLPQGSILSPLFSNVYLSSFDKNISDAGLIMIRYVDDFIILAKTEVAANAAFKRASRELKDLGLKLHPLGHEKTNITTTDGLTFLGILYQNGHFYPSAKAFAKNIQKLKDYPKYKTLFKNIQSLQMLVQSWASTYEFCSDNKEMYETLNHELSTAVSKVLYKARLKPIAGLAPRELRRLGIHQFDNAVVTFNQKKASAKKDRQINTPT